jgi:formiminotetrahydrofolate cyclodeaminase
MILSRLFACGGGAVALINGIISISLTTVLMHNIAIQPQPVRVA